MTPLRINYPISVAILYGNSAYDHESEQVMHQINEALTSRGHMVRVFETNFKNWQKAVRVPGEVVINLIEDDDTDWKLFAKVGRYLHLLGRAQLGLNPKCLLYSSSKQLMKKRLIEHGVSTPESRFIRVNRNKFPNIRGLEYPLIVKPVGSHGSMGIDQDSVVIDETELKQRIEYLAKKLDKKILIEEFIEGDEVHVTVIGNGKHLVTLPYTEIDFVGEYADNWNVFSYNAKWKENTWEFWDAKVNCPVRLPKKVEEKIDKAVFKAFRALNCIDLCRFDVRIDAKGNPYIIDANFCPDLIQNDDAECWLSAKNLDWTYADFMETLVAIAYKRKYGRLPTRIQERQFLLDRPRRIG